MHTGVHYPSDVAAGMLLGGGAAVAASRGLPRCQFFTQPAALQVYRPER